jgi:hypothetical protein
MEMTEAQIKATEKEIRKAICAAVRKLGGACRYTDGWYIRVNGMDIPVDIEAQRTGSSWRRNYTGRFRASVGSYGDKRQFPPRKNTPHGVSAEAVAEELVQRAKAQKQCQTIRKNREERVNEVQPQVDELREVIGEKYFVDIKPVLQGTPGSLEFEPVTKFTIKMSYGVDCTFDEAQTLLTLLRKLREKR